MYICLTPLFTPLFLLILCPFPPLFQPDTGIDPPAPSWYLTTFVSAVSVLELAGNQSGSHSQPPFSVFSFLPIYSPLPALKCPLWTVQKHQHNIMPYQGRHKNPWAHCSSVSASSSFSTLSASAKTPPRLPEHIHAHEHDSRHKNWSGHPNNFGAECTLNYTTVPVL